MVLKIGQQIARSNKVKKKLRNLLPLPLNGPGIVLCSLYLPTTLSNFVTELFVSSVWD